MDRSMDGGWAAAKRYSMLLGAALLAVPALGQPFGGETTPVGRVAGPLVQTVALQGDRLPQGVIASVGKAQIDRHGEIGFVATVIQAGKKREGLFAWSGGAVVPLALEGEETGRGPLLVLASFGGWDWNDGARAVFLGAADANGNGVFDPGVDPEFLFLAEDGRLIPLLRIGDKVDGGPLLAILSFRLNGVGQVAFEALIDRNGDGSFTPGIDTAGIYLLENGRIQPLARTGDRVGDGRIRALRTESGTLLHFNDRSEALLPVDLERQRPALESALILADRSSIRLLARDNLRTPLGTLSTPVNASLNNNGDVVFMATLQQIEARPAALFRVRSRPPVGTLEEVVRPGDAGPDESLIRGFFPGAAIADNGSIAFCGFYDHDPTFVAGDLVNPAACYVLAPEVPVRDRSDGIFDPLGHRR